MTGFPNLPKNTILARLRGISPADLQAVVNTSKRMAMNRMDERDAALPPLILEDFEKALERIQVSL